VVGAIDSAPRRCRCAAAHVVVRVHAVSSLLLIRHGQASFGADDYDVLSALGVQQATYLGRFLAKRSRNASTIDAIYVGPRKRQRDTAKHMAAAAAEHGCELPEAIELAGLDEYPAIELLKTWLPILTADDPAFANLLDGDDESRAQNHAYERAFECIVGKWMNGELDTGELESFDTFAARVHDSNQHIMREQGRGKCVAVVTSGGPIAISMTRSLGLANDAMLRLAWVIANSSISEFRYRDAGELTLVSFNNTPHIEQPMLLTYR